MLVGVLFFFFNPLYSSKPSQLNGSNASRKHGFDSGSVLESKILKNATDVIKVLTNTIYLPIVASL